jgi:fibronectin type 3 domain-containing protein
VSITLAKLSCTVRSCFASSILSRILVGIVLFGVACGAPGEPVAPSPPVAVQITDLTAHQAGDGVQVVFTMPASTLTAERIVSTPAVEILRGAVRQDGSADLKSFRIVDTIPGSLAGKYLAGDKFKFTDPIASEETKAHPGSLVAYTVRTRLSQKRASANSNIVSIRIFNVPERITSIALKLTEPAIELDWGPVKRTSAGDPLLDAPRYNIYRAQLDDDAMNRANHELSKLKWNANFQLLASQTENTYRDRSFEFGKNYAYSVRAAVTVDGGQVESEDSTPVIVTAADIFPPSAPHELSAAVLPGDTEGSLVVDLSWSINVEADFAGYRVYRSEQQGTKGQLLTSELLPTPAYRDTSVQSPHRYWYAVTAVDRAGNESPPSSLVAAEITQPAP